MSCVVTLPYSVLYKQQASYSLEILYDLSNLTNSSTSRFEISSFSSYNYVVGGTAGVIKEGKELLELKPELELLRVVTLVSFRILPTLDPS